MQNRGKEYTYGCLLGRSVIDLTTTTLLVLKLPMRYLKRIWDKNNWIAFTVELDSKTCSTEPSFISMKQMDLMDNKFTKEIAKALDTACPLTKACTVN